MSLGRLASRDLVSRLRAVIGAKDEQMLVLTAALEAALDRERLELRLAEVERRLSMDSTDSGTPSSKERIGAKNAAGAAAAVRARAQEGSQAGRPAGSSGEDAELDPDPGEKKDAGPCGGCTAGLQSVPGRCGGCGIAVGAGGGRAGHADGDRVGAAGPVLPGLRDSHVRGAAARRARRLDYPTGPVLNAAAVVLTAYGNVPPERAAQVMAMLLGVPVSPGWVDKASARLAAQLGKAGLDEAMLAALAGEKALAADETPVNVLDNSAPQPAGREEEDEQDPEEKEKTVPGAPHVLIVRTPDGRLTWLQAIGSRRKAAVAAGIPAAFTGLLMTDGYTGYQHLLSRLAGIQQCCQHIIRRCRAVIKLGPGGLQSWAGDIIAILREAHQAVQEARARGGTALGADLLDNLRQRYDEAAAVRDHPQPAARLARREPPRLRARLLAARLQGAGLPVHPRLRRGLDDQRRRARRQSRQAPRAVSGYWHSLATLARWCRIRGYMTWLPPTASALDAIRTAIEGKPWLPPLPAIS